MAWRIGQSWGSKENRLLVTIVEEGIGEPDADGRRVDDRLVGCAGPVDARRIVDAINFYDRELAAMLERHAEGLRRATRDDS